MNTSSMGSMARGQRWDVHSLLEEPHVVGVTVVEWAWGHRDSQRSDVNQRDVPALIIFINIILVGLNDLRLEN